MEYAEGGGDVPKSPTPLWIPHIYHTLRTWLAILERFSLSSNVEGELDWSGSGYSSNTSSASRADQGQIYGEKKNNHLLPPSSVLFLTNQSYCRYSSITDQTLNSFFVHKCITIRCYATVMSIPVIIFIISKPMFQGFIDLQLYLLPFLIKDRMNLEVDTCTRKTIV